MLVGLGNPGPAYASTRHNVGFLCVRRLADNRGIALDRTGEGALYGLGTLSAVSVALVLPMRYMNRSGGPAAALAGRFGLSRNEILVVHDDLDLTFGKIKIKQKGGHGGHNGLRSLMEVLGGDDFPRLRIGIGRPPEGLDPADYVLSGFGAEQARVLDGLLDLAAEAAEALLVQGTGPAMNQFNNKTV